ncbi:uncharacterized protein C18orf19 homolog A-like isoform X2 [Clavelina lepadiformis]|uniref:uncharacterized protein C18orf19 homolog A-like isoform X2 n=1 Tax=Clavelina lepadiformis TaxID=159417 RepID=UPI004042E074
MSLGLKDVTVRCQKLISNKFLKGRKLLSISAYFSSTVSADGLLKAKKCYSSTATTETENSFLKYCKEYEGIFKEREIKCNSSLLMLASKNTECLAKSLGNQQKITHPYYDHKPVTFCNLLHNSELTQHNIYGLYEAKRWYRTSHSLASNDSQKQEDLSPNDGNPASKANQLKKVFAIYGSFGIAFHIVTSLVSLGICYLIVSSGVDVVGILSKYGIEVSSIAGGASTMVIAYAVHKLLMPIRISITVVSVTVLVRYLRRLGYLKK